MNTKEYFMQLGFEESDIIMCELCNDYVAEKEGRGYEVCMDCFHEVGI